MPEQISPFRLLAKTYESQLVTREQHIEIRAQLLRKLQSHGSVDEADLQNFAMITQNNDTPTTEKSYTSSDWFIIGLGLVASIVLALMLYG
ncbi:MAG: hypothetical protein ACI845_001803 [Gammaproteobacteria bacterium]|jgi:hypothetical protein